MGKKRPASSLEAEEPTNLGFESSTAKLNIRSYEDVANSEDEFLLQRDKILLDERPEAKRRRRLGEEEALLEASDEEVLALPESENSDDSVSISDEDEIGNASAPRPKVPKSEDEPPNNANHEDEDEEYEGWGDTRDAYYGADAIDTEQAALEEEAEAKRLQQKSLQLMSEADFGFDDDFVEEHAERVVDDMEEDVVTEVLPELQITKDMSSEERIKVLKQRYPEFEHIAKEFLDMHSMLEEAKQQAQLAKHLILLRKARPEPNPSSESESHPAILKHHVLAMYLGVVAMYFALLTSTADKNGNALAKPPVDLREHAIMDSLLNSRQLWAAVKDIDYPDINGEIKALRDRIADEEQAVKVDTSEVRVAVPPSESQTSRPKKKKSKAQKAAEAAVAEAEERRAEKMRKLEADLASLSTLTAKSLVTKSKPTTKPAKKIATKSSSPTALEEGSEFGDETQLSARELAEKAQRKKTLRFYTCQIAQKASRRGLAGRDAGGDMDIPHRERFRERQARDAERRKKKDDALDGIAVEISGDDTMSRSMGLPNGDGDDEDYYDMVVAQSKQKKADKAAAAQAYSQAQKEGGRVVEEETVGEDGKRRITYAIEKNKGITPSRRKEVRNPRVKKRMKYKEKQKKLASVRQIYKGGEGKSGYGGELTGIKIGLVKSVKL